MNQPYEAGSSFRPAFFFLKTDQRRALSAYYGFARAVDDIADDRSLPYHEKRRRLDDWTGAVERIFSGAPEGPLEAELARAAGAFPLKQQHLLLVIEGVTSDLTRTRCATLAQLEGYMFRVASAVGLACLAIFRYAEPGADRYAEKMGYAVQLTNILRDVAEDLAAGRVYLPEEDLARFGCTRSDLGGSNYPPNFIELMKFEAARARDYYVQARALAAPAGREQLRTALVMDRLYSGLLEKLERVNFRVKEGRVRLNPLEQAAALFKAWTDYRRLRSC